MQDPRFRCRRPRLDEGGTWDASDYLDKLDRQARRKRRIEWIVFVLSCAFMVWVWWRTR